MGAAYRPNAAGTATANMYGIGWSHPNAGGLGGANQLNDHGMLIINNGTFRAAISSRAVFSADVRTPIYYDWNDTTYYLDPNSTSNSAARIRGGTLHGPNPSWGEYLQVGGNGDNGTWAQVVTTNGNLHLDGRRGGNGIYLQWYNGGPVFVENRIDATIFYDRNSTGFYTDPASTSRMNAITGNIYNSPYPGGDSGLVRSSYAYSWGFQEGGGWSGPFPDTVFQYHTGLTFAANSSYEGMRFKADYNNDTVIFQINGSSNYNYSNNWLKVAGGGVGIYSDFNGAQFLPNNQTSYGSWTVYGQRSGWYGLAFSQVGNLPHLMFAGGGDGGIYYQSIARWQMYHSIGNNCTGFGSSATRSGYIVQINGSLWATGNVVAFSDRRKKDNIKTIENALLKVLQLRGVTYTRKHEAHEDARDDSFQGLQMGMIAQEVEEIVPEVVSYDAEADEYGLDYSKMVGLLVESIKDQHAIVEAQKEIINNQQKDIDKLKEMVYNIQKLMEGK
jgi:hypothetical protein